MLRRNDRLVSKKPVCPNNSVNTHSSSFTTGFTSSSRVDVRAERPEIERGVDVCPVVVVIVVNDCCVVADGSGSVAIIISSGRATHRPGKSYTATVLSSVHISPLARSQYGPSLAMLAAVLEQ